MSADQLTAIRHLHGLMEITRLMVGARSTESLLAAIGRVLAETVGYAGVVINVYRPRWDDYEAATVVGSRELRDALLGATYDRSPWISLVLDKRFERRGAYFIPDGAVDWDTASIGARYLPNLRTDEDSGAWRPGDELFVPCLNSEGDVLAVLSFGEPVTGRRPSDAELDFLVAVGTHAALAIEHAHQALEATRHRAALEQLLVVSSGLAGKVSTESVLQSVCEGVRRALCFRKVLIELVDPASGMLSPRTSVGWAAHERPFWEVPPGGVGSLLAPQFERGGCYLLTPEAARECGRDEHEGFRSQTIGRGPRAWDRHWLFVPLRGEDGIVVGRIWVDEPDDGLLPAQAHLEALAVFANQATMAIVSAARLEQLRVLADQDPLTKLRNRRAFMRDLDGEVERARRYERPLTLVLLDLDQFKALNDTHGHPAGDQALRQLGSVLTRGLRAGDTAYRIGGDEFALLQPETTTANALATAARLVDVFQTTAEPPFAGIGVTCGAAELVLDCVDGESLIRRADTALYAAKRARTPHDAEPALHRQAA